MDKKNCKNCLWLESVDDGDSDHSYKSGLTCFHRVNTARNYAEEVRIIARFDDDSYLEKSKRCFVPKIDSIPYNQQG